MRLLFLVLLFFVFPAEAKKIYKPIIDPVVAEQHKRLFAPRLVETSIGIEYWRRIERMGVPIIRKYKWGK